LNSDQDRYGLKGVLFVMGTMKLSDYNLLNDFEILGKWYLKNQTIDDAIDGTLHYSYDSILLNLNDTFGDDLIEDYNKDLMKIVYGFSQNGKLIILKDCIPINGNMSFPGYSIMTIKVQEFWILDPPISGWDENILNKLSSDDKLMLKTLTFSTNYIYSWLNNDAVEIISIPDKSIMSVQYNPEKFKSREFFIKSKNVSVKDKSTVNFVRKENMNNNSVCVISSGSLELQPQDEIEFYTIFEIAKSLKKLIDFLYGRPLHFEYIEFVLDYKELNGKRQIGRYFYNQIGDIQRKQLNPLIPFNKIEKDFDTILNKWFEKEEKLHFIINSYLNDLHLPYYVETQLLNSIRSLEIYYRNFIKENDEERHEKVGQYIEEITSYINKHVPEEHRKYFIERINYVGEDSLNKKLRYLFRQLPEPLRDKYIKIDGKSLSKSCESFANSLAQTRNYYTHGYKPQKYPARIKGVYNLYKANRTLRKIIQYYVFKEIGVSETTILECLLQNN
jgi:hypothetical protein